MRFLLSGIRIPEKECDRVCQRTVSASGKKLSCTAIHIMSVCQSLSPPPPPRHRASSITIRSTFSLNSLGRRRSNSCLQSPSQDSPTPSAPESISTAVPPPSMLILIASRFLQWAHLQPKQHLSWSTPSSPRSSADESVLPLSASAVQTSFGDDIHQNPPQTHRCRHGFWAVSYFPSLP